MYDNNKYTLYIIHAAFLTIWYTELAFYLEKYFQSKIEATVDGKELTVNVLGAEFIDDQIVLYIELPVTKMPETIKMKFTALFEVFDDQKNMVHYKINDKRKSMVMTKERPQETLTFS